MTNLGSWEDVRHGLLGNVPRAVTVIDGLLGLAWHPGPGELVLRLGARRPSGWTPPPLANVETRVLADRVELAVRDSDLFSQLYSLATHIEAMLIAGTPVGHALDHCIAALLAFAERSRPIGAAREAGIFGELLFVCSLAEHGGWTRAVKAWTDGTVDFRLEDVDIEVKASRSPERVHKISSGAQLRDDGRTKFLASLLIADAGAASGLSANDLYLQIVNELPPGEARLTFEQRVATRGVPVAAAPRAWLIVGDFELVLIDESFPALTLDTAREAVGPAGCRVRSVEYSVDVTGLGRPMEDASVAKFLSSED